MIVAAGTAAGGPISLPPSQRKKEGRTLLDDPQPRLRRRLLRIIRHLLPRIPRRRLRQRAILLLSRIRQILLLATAVHRNRRLLARRLMRRRGPLDDLHPIVATRRVLPLEEGSRPALLPRRTRRPTALGPLDLPLPLRRRRPEPLSLLLVALHPPSLSLVVIVRIRLLVIVLLRHDRLRRRKAERHQSLIPPRPRPRRILADVAHPIAVLRRVGRKSLLAEISTCARGVSKFPAAGKGRTHRSRRGDRS